MERPEVLGEVNNSIRRLATTGVTGETWDFYCECPDIGCHSMVSLTLGQFDAFRSASPPLPIVAANHE